MAADHQETDARKFLRALPGYPFLPCRICVSEGFAGDCCDHTVLERAQGMHPGLVALPSTDLKN